MIEGPGPRTAPSRPSSIAAARVRQNVIVVGVAVVLLVVASLIARARLSPTEVRLFRSVNELPEGLNVAVTPIMQYGTFITIPILAGIALLFRRIRLAVAVLLAGVGVYLLALVTKQIVERGRPGALIVGVEERETFAEDSLGFPSGHAAVAAAITAVVSAHLSVRWTILALVVGIVVLFGRIYVGAHLPLDVIGGAALGAIAGSIVNLVVRPPTIAEGTSEEGGASAGRRGHLG